MTATYVGAKIALVTALIGAFAIIGPALLLILSFVSGFIRAFNVPARSAMVYALAEPRYLLSGIGVNSATYYDGNFIVQALAGVVITQRGV